MQVLNSNGGVVKVPWMQTLQVLAQFIKEVGFPVFVAVYVLVRLEPVLARMNSSIGDLAKAIAVLSERIALMR